MYSKKYFLKTLAIFMALNILTQVLAPTVAFALTSGPTTPEVASFEPVDTTDMVDLATGDFNYNIPLIDIPGPEGGYPVALSYHGGVLPAQDASWVGLGWNLNPGCINRTVNNFADDYCGAKYKVEDFWNGGETTEYNFGIGVGVANVVSVGIDVGIKNDTYRGSGGSFGLSAGLGMKYGMGVNASIGYDTWNGDFGSVGIDASNVLAGAGATVGFSGGQTYAAIGLSTTLTQANMGISLSSAGLKTSASMGGFYSGHNDNFGRIQTSTDGVNMQFPIYCFYISVGYKYTRYWMHGTDQTILYGMLNSKAASDASATPYTTASLDCNILYDPEQNLATQKDLDWTTNPVVACYDNYSVLSQGLSGSIEPIMLDNGSFFRKTYLNPDNGHGKMKTEIFRPFTISKHQFRFRNDFSNSHKITQSDFTVSGSLVSYPSSGMAYTADQVDPRGVIQSVDGSNRLIEKKIAGSRHVEYFTNAEIAAGTATGFINTTAVPNTERITRTFLNGIDSETGMPDYQTFRDVSKNIGGYSITNANGITYHYALPVYTFDYYQSSGSTNSKTGSILSRFVSNPDPYAYTWMLTSVTGPDYIDNNHNGLADASDWGYWVNFNYGRWTNRFGYRTPDTGANSDIDGSTSMSKGGKEIYYLNSIITRTHTALFVKDSRPDGRGTNSKDYDTYTKNGAYDTYTSVRSLKLSEIILLENKFLESYSYYFTATTLAQYHATRLDNNSFVNGECNKKIYGGGGTEYLANVFWENVIDVGDLNSFHYEQKIGDLLRNAAVKQVRFEYDNSLCLNTTNSFNTSESVKSGKLTLKAVRFYGRNQVQLLPSTNFKYDLTNPVQGNVQITHIPGVDAGFTGRMGRVSCGTNTFAVGDILTFSVNGKTFFTTLTKGNGTPNTTYDVVFLGNALPVTGDKAISASAVQTKNPPYTNEFYDIWGMFKSDYSPKSGVKRNKARYTTDVSSKGVDCWNLQSIETPTGTKININYESDDYKDVVLKNKQIYNLLPTSSIKRSSETTYSALSGIQPIFWGTESLDFTFQINSGDLQVPIDQVFSVGDKIEIVTAGYYMSYPHHPRLFWEKVKINKGIVTVIGITANTISVRDPNNKICMAPNTVDFVINNLDARNYSHLGSYIFGVDKSLHFGGGLRTKSIQVTDGSISSKTTYQYKDIANNSSGSTAFDPLCYDEIEIITDLDGVLNSVVPQYSEYASEYYNAFVKIMAMSKDFIAPGVVYESVKVKNSVTKNSITTDAPTYQAYQFQLFKEDMVTCTNLPENIGNDHTKTRTSKITDKSNQIGNLLSIKTYDKNNRLLSEVSNNYTSTPENDQGIIEQVFHEQRRMNPGEPNGDYRYGSVTVKSQYPTVLLSTTNKDYTKGLSTTTINTAFDFYTGAVTETQTTDGYGNTYMSINDPAYNWYNLGGTYGGMGMMVNGGVNMLTQNSGYYVIKKNAVAGTYPVTVTNAATSVGPKQILVTMTGGVKLPLACHAGTKISGLTLPVFVTWISNDRTQFKAISRAATITADLGSKTITMDNGSVLKASVTTWSENWNYRMGNNQYGYGTSSIQDYTYFIDRYTGIIVDQTKWRIKSSYTWDSPYLNTDGTYPATGMGAFVPFDYSASGAQSSAYWKAVNTNTLYTQYSKLLESKNINNQYSSTKYSEDQSLICGTAVNARYMEFTVNSGEHGEGEFTGTTSTTYVHTGVNSYMLNPNGGKIAYAANYEQVGDNSGFDKGKQYRISAWVHKDNIVNAQLFYTSTVNGSATTTTQSYDATKHTKCGNWILMTMDITTTTAAGTNLKLEVGVKNAGSSNYVYADDFRFQPFVSSVQSFVYDTNTGLLSYVLGADNRYVRYEYDSRYRLKATYQETTNGEVKVNEYNYNFARTIPD